MVITGIGPVCSLGNGFTSFRETLRKGGESAVTPQPLPEKYLKHYQPHTRFYLPIPEVSLEAFGLDKRYGNIMQDESKIALASSALALTDAGIPYSANGTTLAKTDRKNAGVVIGIGIAGLRNAFNSYLAHIGCKTAENGSARYQRMIIPMIMPNAAAAWVSMYFGLTGGSCTVNASCASGTSAIGQAYQHIASGMNKWMLCGGVESLSDDTGSILRGFDMLGVLTRSGNGFPQPFTDKRSGFLFAEGGGCMFVVEELEHALRRGARIHAEMTCFAETSDAYNIVQTDPEGKGCEALLRKLIANGKIDHLNTHGTGTQRNDAMERDVIRRVFGKRERQPLLSATKSVIGHTIGASGAIEAAVCIASIRDSIVHANYCDEPFPQLNLHRDCQHAEIRCAASVSYGFGGHNSAVMFESFQENR